MCAAALVLGVAAVASDVATRLDLWSPPVSLPRLLSAASLGLLGVALTWSSLERRSRELPRRTVGFMIFAVGNALLYLGQMLTYLYVANEPGRFAGWVEALPLLCAGLPLAVGMLLLSWPPGLSRPELWGVARDGALATVGLLTAWMALIVPAQASSSSVDGTWIAAIDPWTQFLGFVALAFVAATSRRSGSLPINQLILLQVGVAVYLVSDILGTRFPAQIWSRGLPIRWSVTASRRTSCCGSWCDPLWRPIRPVVADCGICGRISCPTCRSLWPVWHCSSVVRSTGRWHRG